MAITFDRKTHGKVGLFLDGKSLANGTLPLVASPKIGQDIWFNAQEWDKLDTGFRGTLNRFTMYADALPPQALASPISSTSRKSSSLSKLKAKIDIPHATSSPWALLFPCVILMMALLLLVRRKKGLLMAIPEYASRIPELAKNVPELAMDLVKRSPWMRSPATKA